MEDDFLQKMQDIMRVTDEQNKRYNELLKPFESTGLCATGLQTSLTALMDVPNIQSGFLNSLCNPIQDELDQRRRFEDARIKLAKHTAPGNVPERRFEDLDIQARYGQLPDFLELDEFAHLMGEAIKPFVAFMMSSGLKVENINTQTGDRVTGAVKEEYRRWLTNKRALPVDGALAKWLDNGPQAENAGNIGKLETVAVNDGLSPPQTDFDKRLAVLQSWLEKQNYYVPGIITTLPKEISHNNIHTILNKESKDSSLFDVTLESFVRHFWTPQKIAQLKRGR